MSEITAVAGTYYEAVVVGFDPGLLGTLGVRLEDGDSNIVMARQVTGIIESPAASGIYTANLLAPATAGTYTVIWDDGVDFTAEQLVVTSAAAQPLPVASLDGDGPCSAWTSPTLVSACCAGAEGDLLDQSIAVASDALWALSGRIYSGLCEAIVRPATGEGRCFGRWRRETWVRQGLGCRAYDRVRLAGYPIRSITEVRIDGATIDPATYVLEADRYLVRLTPTDEQPEGWPGCQYLDRPLGEVGTWCVAYTYGADPPAAGQVAAAALACQVYRACSTGECALPPNVAEITRQGVRAAARGRDLFVSLSDGGLRTGIPSVDTFLAAYGSAPARRPAVWSPDVPHYPIRQEAQGGP